MRGSTATAGQHTHVVLEEVAEQGRVLDAGLERVVHGRELGDAAVGRLERPAEGVVRGVVEDAVHDLGVGRAVVDAALEDLADRVDARGGRKVGPEVLADVLDSVNAQAVNAEGAATWRSALRALNDRSDCRAKEGGTRTSSR